jgi:hypothetical protein
VPGSGVHGTLIGLVGASPLAQRTIYGHLVGTEMTCARKESTCQEDRLACLRHILALGINQSHRV